jgi:hypothetical protein
MGINLRKAMYATLTGLAMLVQTSHSQNLEKRVEFNNEVNQTQNSKIQAQNQRDLPHIMLDLEKYSGTKSQDYKKIDEIIDTATNRIKPKIQEMIGRNHVEWDALDIFKEIDKVIKEKGFRYEEKGLLNDGLKSSKLDCDLYSSIYFGIGERMNLPIEMVYIAPRKEKNGHIFVRWKEKDFSINWETTCSVGVDDAGISSKFDSENYYPMETITKNKYLAMHARSVAGSIRTPSKIPDNFFKIDKKDVKKRLEEDKKIEEVYQIIIREINNEISNNPNNPTLIRNRALIYEDLAITQSDHGKRCKYFSEVSSDVDTLKEIESKSSK